MLLFTILSTFLYFQQADIVERVVHRPRRAHGVLRARRPAGQRADAGHPAVPDRADHEAARRRADADHRPGAHVDRLRVARAGADGGRRRRLPGAAPRRQLRHRPADARGAASPWCRREDKYKAKNFIDTVVYRVGDQVGRLGVEPAWPWPGSAPGRSPGRQCRWPWPGWPTPGGWDAAGDNGVWRRAAGHDGGPRSHDWLAAGETGDDTHPKRLARVDSRRRRRPGPRPAAAVGPGQDPHPWHPVERRADSGHRAGQLGDVRAGRPQRGPHGAARRLQGDGRPRCHGVRHRAGLRRVGRSGGQASPPS